MPATYEIEQYARLELTGDPDAAAPTDDALAPFVVRAVGEILPGNPCIGGDPENDLSDADLEAYNNFVGARAARYYVSTIAGQRAMGIGGGSTEVKLGPVTRKTSQASVADITSALIASENAARARISCIREQIVERNRRSGGLVVLAGRRRAIGEPKTLERQMLGEGAE